MHSRSVPSQYGDGCANPLGDAGLTSRMSAMWQITVREIRSQWVDLELVFHHPDAGSFPEDRTFALCLLTGEAYRYDSDAGRNISRCPLGDAIAFDKSYAPNDVEERVDEFVRRVVIYETHNVPWDEAAAHEQVDHEVLAHGIGRDSDQWTDAWHRHWGRYWEDKNSLPWAVYRIWVTDPKWLQHLSIGMTFESAAFSLSGPWVNEARNMPVNST